MRSRNMLFIIIGLLLVIDLYVFQAIRSLVQHSSSTVKMIVYAAYWLIAAASIGFLLLFPQLNDLRWYKNWRLVLFSLVLALFLGKLIAAVFFLIDDLRRGLQWTVEKIMMATSKQQVQASYSISRSRFLTSLGLILGGSFIGTFIYGFTNKYNYRIKRMQLHFPDLPPSFKGLKILQISDIHSGSFDNRQKVMQGVKMAMKENADIIFFTGDLVNDRATEMKNYQLVFSKIKAPMGVYATLGNHDYGDYTHWPSQEAKAKNLEHLKQIEADMGWKMLNNDHVILSRGEDKIAIIGVENWSTKAHFTKYGDLPKAYKGTEAIPFKILLSHDPSHWDAQVRPDFPDIALTFSGHTHGAQFGVEIPGVKWSPIEYVYKEWAGLYNEGKQFLYVNRGYGFLGYPGRVGILPEITVIELS